MNIDFAFLCDYANVTNKVNALGIGFDAIYAKEVPARYPVFFLVIQMRAHKVECGEKDIKINLIDEDGQEIMPTVNGKLRIPPPVSGTESTGRLAINFNNIQFPRYCSYSLHAVIDGHEMVRIPFKVSPPPQKPVNKIE